MAVEFRMPDIGEGIATVDVVEWHVAVGDVVAEDQPMVDVQTDKAITTIACPVAGVVEALLVEDGVTVDVGTALIRFGSGDGEVPAPTAPPAPPAPAAGSAVTAASPLSPAMRDATASAAAASPAGRPLASPAVRKRARDLGIDLTTVRGSGPGGRIVREDLDAGPVSAAATAPAAPPGPPAVDASGEDVVEPLRGTRRAIARSLTASWQAIPHVMDFREADASRLLEARVALRAQAERRGDTDGAKALSAFALLAKIAAVVVRRHPALRSSCDLEREEITRYANVHLSVPVSAPDGLVAPVIRGADRLALGDLAREIARLGAAARRRELLAAELTGGTFTVNNYGALGSPLATTLIQPGQSSNLGFGRITDKPVARDGQVVVRPILGISCSADHRVMDGAEVQAFVNDLLAAIEEPVLLLEDLV